MTFFAEKWLLITFIVVMIPDGKSPGWPTWNDKKQREPEKSRKM